MRSFSDTVGANSRGESEDAMLTALAGCAVRVIRDTLAPQLGIPVDDVAASAGYLSEGEPSIRRIGLDVFIRSPMHEAAVEELLEAWREGNPIVLDVSRPTELTVSFRLV
jgi:hypothetical protein